MPERKVTQKEIEQSTESLIEIFGEDYPWQWDERHHALLSEFASNKKEKILTYLTQHFSHQWDAKTIKSAPQVLKQELGSLTKLTKEQQLFTCPASENTPALLAIWWPWGHGSTISLRLTVLEDGYQESEVLAPKDNFLTVIKKLFSI
jgi:hypothetical protein